jgi:hypothetical protein
MFAGWFVTVMGLLVGWLVMGTHPPSYGTPSILWMFGFLMTGMSLLTAVASLRLSLWLNLRDKIVKLIRRYSGIFLVDGVSSESEVALANGTRLRTILNSAGSMAPCVAYFYESDTSVTDIYTFNQDGHVNWSTDQKKLRRTEATPGWFQLFGLYRMLRRFGVVSRLSNLA